MKTKLLLLIAFLISNLGLAQVSITSATPYTQDFTALGTSTSWSNNTTMSGWYCTTGGSLSISHSSTSNNVYNCGSASSVNGITDRALGALSTGTTHRFGVRMKNDNASAILAFTVAFTGEQWRNTTNAHILVFEYQIDPAAITNITNAGTWTPVTALDFTAPIVGTAANIDGNLTANQSMKNATFAVNVPAGSEIMFRWTKAGSTSPILAVDDLVITPSFTAMASESFDFNNYFSLYPNPTTNLLNLEVKNGIEINGISIYNMLGQLVLNSNADLKIIDVSSLNTGNYFIKIATDKGITTSKFVKE